MAISLEDLRSIRVAERPRAHLGHISFSLRALIPNTNAPCEILISAYSETTGSVCLLSIVETGHPIVAELLDTLIGKRILNGYVRLDELDTLRNYFRDSIREAAKRDNLPPDKWGCLIYENTLCALKAAVLDPRNGKRLTVGTLMVRDIVDRFWREDELRKALLSIMTWDDQLYSHCLNVCLLGFNLMRSQGWEHRVIDELSQAFLFYDLGMTTLPPGIYEKNTSLGNDEHKRAENHPVVSCELLEQAPGITPAILDIILCHHENLDGTGYPRKLSGEQLSPPARLLRVIDVYDSMTSPSTGGRPLKPEEALSEMTHAMSEKLDQKIVKEFIASLGLT